MNTTAPFLVRHRTTVLAVVVLIAGFAAHVTSVAGGFVYDDHRFVERNEAIQSIDVVRFFTDASSASHGEGIQHDIYRPLRTLLFSLEYAVFGTDATGWHAVSLLLHLLNAVLLFLLIRIWLGDRGVWGEAAAAGAAALFAAHPVTVESVAWISSQGDLLALTFMLSALIVFSKSGVRASVIGTVLFALACFAKESALVLPALVFLEDLVLRGRNAERAPSWRTTWIRIAVMAAFIALYFVLRQSVVPVLKQVDHPGGSILASVRSMLSSLVWYLGALVAPHGFTFDVKLDVPLRFSDPDVIVGLGLLVTTVLLGVFGLVKKRYVVALAALGFLACLVPVSNVIVPLKAFVAERFLYPGLICLAAGVAVALLAFKGTARWVAFGVGAVALLWCVVMSTQRTEAWQDEAHLWDAVRHDRPTNPNAYQGLAFAYFERGRVKDAERAFDTYLGFNRIDGKAWKVRGDNFGKAAESLVREQVAGEETNVQQNRILARKAQIDSYRRAIEIWDRWDLIAGRGSPEMRESMLLQWMDVGAELGDVAAQKWANDRLIRDEGVDPEDVDAVWSQASWPRRFARLRMALQVIRTPIGSRAPAEHAAALRQRADALSDARLDPRQPNDRLRQPLGALFVAMVEGSATTGHRLTPNTYEYIARDLATVGRLKDSLRVLEVGARMHPNHAGLQGLVPAVRKRVEQGQNGLNERRGPRQPAPPGRPGGGRRR